MLYGTQRETKKRKKEKEFQQIDPQILINRGKSISIVALAFRLMLANCFNKQSKMSLFPLFENAMRLMMHKQPSQAQKIIEIS